MKENDVAYFGKLLGLEAKDVEKAIEDGSLSDKFTALNLIGKDQVEALKTNLTNEVKNSYLSELAEKAKSGDLPKELYDPIHGAVHERIEKELAKTYDVEKGNLQDMISKISKNGQSNDKGELQKKIEELQNMKLELQGINEKLVKEKEEAISSAKAEYEGKVLLRDKTDHLNKLPFDFSDVEDGELQKVSESRKRIVTSVFDASFSLAFAGDKLVVKDKDGSIVKDPVTLEPLPVSNVMMNVAKEVGMKLTSPEPGGLGGKSSDGNGSTKFKNVEEFGAYCNEKGINPNGEEGVAIWNERKPQ